MPDLSTKSKRQRLKKRREPHWMRVTQGSYLGFRRTSETWVARFRDRNGKQHTQALRGALDYDEAMRHAEEWFAEMGSSAVRTAQRGTVRDALLTYVAELERRGRQATADNATDRFRLIVWDDPVADVPLEDLTLQDMEEWRDRLRDGRQNRTVNRHVRSIVAGLTMAHKKGHVGNPDAWSLEPLPDDVEETADTTVFLTAEQRDAIVQAASSACADFLRAISYTGGRPGELAAAVRADFDSKGGTLILKHKKGRPAKLRPRAVVLSSEATTFFKRRARGKLPTAPLLLDPNGNAWNRHKWADEIQAAIATHNKGAKTKDRIPPGVSAYSFRHARISELLQVHGIDPLTVGAQTGTSIAMIEKYYFRFIAPALRDKLAAIEGTT